MVNRSARGGTWITHEDLPRHLLSAKARSHLTSPEPPTRQSQALIHIGDLVEELQQAKGHGILADNVTVDMAAVQQWKNDIVKRLTGGVGTLLKHRKVEVLQGHAKLTQGDTMISSSHLRITKLPGPVITFCR